MNNHQKEQAYKEQQEYIKKKYWPNILNLSKHHNGIETNICIKILCENARASRDGRIKEIWAGMGKVDMKELIADVETLDTFIVHQ